MTFAHVINDGCGCVIVGMVCVVGLGVVGGVLGRFGQIVGGLVGFGLAGAWLGRRRSKGKQSNDLYRKNYRFGVSRNGITLDGTLYPTDSIYRVLIHNHIADGLASPAIGVETGRGVAYSAGRRAGLTYMSQLALVSHRLEFEAGGVAHVLAGGLTEAGAFGLMTDVQKALGR